MLGAVGRSEPADTNRTPYTCQSGVFISYIASGTQGTFVPFAFPCPPPSFSIPHDRSHQKLQLCYLVATTAHQSTSDSSSSPHNHLPSSHDHLRVEECFPQLGKIQLASLHPAGTLDPAGQTPIFQPGSRVSWPSSPHAICQPSGTASPLAIAHESHNPLSAPLSASFSIPSQLGLVRTNPISCLVSEGGLSVRYFCCLRAGQLQASCRVRG